MMKLAFINSIKISFCPVWSTPGIRELINRVGTKKAQASNPKCKVDIDVLDTNGMYNEVPNTVDIEYTDGTKEQILCQKGMRVTDIQEIILRRTGAMEIDMEIKEMMANPVVGPTPLKFFKGRMGKHYCVYAEGAVEPSKRAAGGVKTIKKK